MQIYDIKYDIIYMIIYDIWYNIKCYKCKTNNTAFKTK